MEEGELSWIREWISGVGVLRKDSKDKQTPESKDVRTDKSL